MKKIKLFTVLLFITVLSFSQNCITFTNDSPLNNWRGSFINQLSYETDGTHGNYLYFVDGSGPSYVGNNVDFSGNWIKKYPNDCLCFDYKVDWNAQYGSNAGSVPKLTIYTGNPVNGAWGNVSNNVRAAFSGNTSNPNIQDDVWGNYCLPIKKAENGQLPSNQFGIWKIYGPGAGNELTGNAAVSAWNNLIENVTGLILTADYNSTPSEKVSFDNFCATCTNPNSGTGGVVVYENNNGYDIDFSDVAIPKPQETTSDCCPPWNEETIRDNMTIKQNLSGGLNANYTVWFTPTSTLKNQMQAYIDYAHAMNPAINAIIINWRLGKVSGDTCEGLGAEIGGQMFTTWDAGNNGNINGGNFWSGFPMEVGIWYKLHTGIYLNDGNEFFDKDCANNDICIRIQVQNGMKVLEVNSNGKIFKTAGKLKSRTINKKITPIRQKKTNPIRHTRYRKNN